jgi:glucosamine-6-phosphate deaminase
MSHNDVMDTGGTMTVSNLHVASSYDEMSRLAADIVTRVIEEHPGSAITLPTGETPRGMFEELTRRIERGDLDFSTIHLFCLDDYLGKGIDDEASLTAWLDEVFLTPNNLHGDNIHLIPSLAADPGTAAADYERAISELGGLKLAVVGLGPNGHIGFNEPGSAIDSRTRVVDLTDESRDQNAAYYAGDQTIPDKAITMGLGTILEADVVVLIVSGSSKAGILQAALEGPITSAVPGSFLRTLGERLIVIVDKEAASSLA